MTDLVTHKEDCHFVVLLKDSHCLKEEEGKLCSCNGWENWKKNKLIKVKKKNQDTWNIVGQILGSVLLIISMVVGIFAGLIYAINRNEESLMACKRACEYRFIELGQRYPILTCICLNNQGLKVEKEAQKELNELRKEK